MKRTRDALSNAITILSLMTSFSAFARTTFPFKADAPATVGGTELGPGVYRVSCRSHSTEATVRFRRGRKIVATAEAKWVTRGLKYDRNSVVYSTGGNSQQRILEIRFAGENRALVFLGKPRVVRPPDRLSNLDYDLWRSIYPQRAPVPRQHN